MSQLFDKRGIPIKRGDIVKVFHFFGKRRKRHYMYKQCLGPIGVATIPYLAFSHLNFITDVKASGGPYLELANGRHLRDYEIVQSIDSKFEERPRASTTGGSSDGR